MNVRRVKNLFLSLVLCFPIFSFAANPHWVIVPEKSHITFTGTQNHAPITGQFNIFSGEINFDPSQLAGSHVIIKIATASITTSYKEVEKILKTEDWFDVAKYPTAIFKADDFAKTGPQIYIANGSLTLRDQTKPVNVVFKIEKYTDQEAIVSGSTVLQRTQFGIGRGEWAVTDVIEDDIKINFKLVAIKN